jgi:hypothetical protein
VNATFDVLLLRLVQGSLRIAERVDDPPALQALLRDLGFDVPSGFTLGEIGDAVGFALGVFEDFRRTPDLERLSAAQITRAALAVGGIALAVARLPGVVNGALPPDFVAASNIAERLPRRLLDWLAIEEIAQSQPALYHAARLAGLIEIDARAADPATYRTDFTERVVRWDRAIVAFVDPLGAFRDRYRWGDATFDVAAVLEAARDLLRALGVPADVVASSGAAPEPVLRVPLLSQNQDELLLSATASAAPASAPGGAPGLRAALEWAASVSVEIEIAPGFTVIVEFGTSLTGRLELAIRPQSPPEVALTGGTGDVAAGRFTIDVTRRGLNGPLPLLTINPTLRLEAGAMRWAAGVEATAGQSPEVFTEIAIHEGRFVVSAGDGDGFLQSLLPAEGSNILFDVTVGVGSERGPYLSGSGGLETAFSIHASLGPITIETLHLGLFGSERDVQLHAAVSGNAALGPLAASVERVGVRLLLGLEPGNLGPVDLGIGFKPPTGLGVAIDAGPVTGGGFISYDDRAGRYAGVLQLKIFGIGVDAIGLLDTRFPDGRRGYSFLIIIAVTLPPIQLGFGFVLDGVGGLCGIQRTVVVQAIQDGVRNGAIDHIMFPQDPVQNAPQIISDLSTIFPPTEGHYVFGPMARIGWGTPTLIAIELGILLELPGPRIVILGQVSMILPDEDAALIELHLDIVGILDVPGKLIAVDASLHDSRVAAFSIFGDIAFRLSWGDPPSFAFSVGGLNPHFQPPPGFPALRRVGVSIGFEDNPRIALQGYFAITSNSLQFGALAELYAAAWELSVYGWLGFDALFIFSPFSFRIDFTCGFELRWGDDPFAGISVTGLLAGVSPWRVAGEACISILFFEVCIGFDVTFGESRQVTPPTIDPWPMLRDAIQEPRNWSASLPPDIERVIALRLPPSGEAQAPTGLVEPMGGLTLRQRVLPFERPLTRFGEATPIGPDHYSITEVRLGDQPVTYARVDDFFAPAQYTELSDAEKLSSPSFERMPAGVSLRSDAVEAGPGVSRTLEYDSTIIDSPWDGRPSATYVPSAEQQLSMVAGGAVARSPLRTAGLGQYAPDPNAPNGVRFEEETFVVASTDDLTLRADVTGPVPKGQALVALRRYLVDHPQERHTLQVIAAHEAVAA